MKNFTQIIEQNKVVPASAKVDKIDNQWLDPASHDKKMVDGMHPKHTYDYKDFDDINFSAEKLLKKDESKAKKTTSKGNPETPEVNDGVNKKTMMEDTTDLAMVYENECWDLVDDIQVLMSESNTMYYDKWREIANCLRTTRDILVKCLDIAEKQYVDNEPAQSTEGVYESKQAARKVRVSEDCNNEKESVVGTSAPAMDSESKKKKDEINEINQRAFSRITGIKPITYRGPSQSDSQKSGDDSNYKDPKQVAHDKAKLEDRGTKKKVTEEKEQLQELLPMYLSSKFRKTARLALSKGIKAKKKIATPGQTEKVSEQPSKE